MNGTEFVQKYAAHLDEVSARREAARYDAGVAEDLRIEAVRDRCVANVIELANQHEVVIAALANLAMAIEAERVRLGPGFTDWRGAALQRLHEAGLLQLTPGAVAAVRKAIGGRTQ